MVEVEDRRENVRLWTTVPKSFAEKIEDAARRYNMSVSAYVAMVASIGHDAFNRGKRIVYMDDESNEK